MKPMQATIVTQPVMLLILLLFSTNAFAYDIVENVETKVSQEKIINAAQRFSRLTGLPITAILKNSLFHFSFADDKDESGMFFFRSFYTTSDPYNKKVLEDKTLLVNQLWENGKENFGGEYGRFGNCILDGESAAVRRFFFPDFKNARSYSIFFVGRRGDDGTLILRRLLDDGTLQIYCFYRSI